MNGIGYHAKAKSFKFHANVRFPSPIIRPAVETLNGRVSRYTMTVLFMSHAKRRKLVEH